MQGPYRGPAKRPQFIRERATTFNTARAWRTVPADSLQPGDIVPDRGAVKAVSVSANTAIEFVSGKVEMYAAGDRIFAFTTAA